MPHVVLVTRAKKDGVLVEHVGIVGTLAERKELSTPGEETHGLLVPKDEFMEACENLGLVVPYVERLIAEGVFDEEVRRRAGELGLSAAEDACAKCGADLDGEEHFECSLCGDTHCEDCSALHACEPKADGERAGA